MSRAAQPIVRSFCVGQAKSGTASLAGLLSGAFRVEHEPERAATLDLIVRHDRGDLSSDELCALLRERDQRLALDVDVAWTNQFLAQPLMEAFPDATFIVLIRDPWTWLGSIVGHLFSRDIPSEVRGFLDWWFRPEIHPGGAEDEQLKRGGTYAVEAFIAAWVRHVESSLDEIPASRRLVIRTHELHESHETIASFLDVPVDALTTELGHRNRSTFSGSMDDVVSPEHVDAVIQDLAQPTLQRIFPGVKTRADAGRLWTRTE